MAQKIKLKRTKVKGNTPSSANIDYGELVINYASGVGESFLVVKKENGALAKFREQTYNDAVYANKELYEGTQSVVETINNAYISSAVMSSAATTPSVTNHKLTIPTVAGQQGPKGAQGPTGPQGATGSNGSNGSQGPKGDQGAKGDQGPKGAQGPTGPQGSAGSNGDQGPKGPQGATGGKGDQGPQGPQGATGSNGSQGPKGDQGAKGDQGPKGAQGPTGPQGSAGSNGDQGPKGPQGATGGKGDQGPQGPQGATGGKGDQGPKGPQGATGSQGPQGPQGATGGKGDQGPKGPQGATGSQGPQGPKGNTGSAPEILFRSAYGWFYPYNGAVTPPFEADWNEAWEYPFPGIGFEVYDQTNTQVAGYIGAPYIPGPQGPQGANGGSGPNFTVSTAATKQYLIGVGSTTGNINTSKTNANVYMSGGCIYALSDERLKDFSNDVECDLDEIKKIPKKYFTWKQDKDKIINIGTSAQQLANIYPELVTIDEGGIYAVNYEKLSIIALAAVDKLHEENLKLKEEIQKIKEKLGII